MQPIGLHKTASHLESIAGRMVNAFMDYIPTYYWDLLYPAVHNTVPRTGLLRLRFVGIYETGKE